MLNHPEPIASKDTRIQRSKVKLNIQQIITKIFFPGNAQRQWCNAADEHSFLSIVYTDRFQIMIPTRVCCSKPQTVQEEFKAEIINSL